MHKAWLLATAIAALMLCGCSWLPSAGPTARGIENDATNEKGQERFVLINVNDDVVKALLSQPKPSFKKSFGGYGPPPPHHISVGDVLRVTIWEAGGGTLFGASAAAEISPSGNIPDGARGTTLPDQTILSDGAVVVPFAGRIKVVGMTTAEVGRAIQSRLSQKATEPQVIVTMPRSPSDSVTVTGEVVKGAVVPLTPNGERILDVLATVGGTQSPAYETFVRLSRNDVTVMVPLQQLLDDSGENVFVWPGDVLSLMRVPRSFEAFGATGKNSQILFEQRKVTLAEALAKSAGLNDERADPAGVFLLRIEQESVIRALRRAPRVRMPDGGVPVVYHLNIRDPKGYFLANEFPIEDKDIIYVANAETNSMQKFFILVSALASPVLTAIITLETVHP